MDPIEDTLEAHLSRHTVRSQPVYYGVLGAVIGAIALMPVLKVGVSVQGDGIVRPVVEKHEVRSIATGLVDEVYVRPHQFVEAGAALIRISDTASRGLRASIAAQLRETLAMVGDLERLVPEGPNVTSDVFRTSRYREEHARFLRLLAELELRADQARRELERARRLAELDLASRREAENRAYEVARLEAEGRSLEQSHRSEWQDRLTELRVEARDLRRRLTEADEEIERLTVRAPVAGSIEELASMSPGSFVQAGQDVARISPAGKLVAEVFVPPGDIGLLRKGLPARVLIDAFNYNDWGFITGRIAEISEDFVLVDHAPRFRIVVEMDRTHLDLANGARGDLRKGMTLRARFMIADRSLWQLLRDDILDWIHPRHSPAQP